jgi:hypothetical protein
MGDKIKNGGFKIFQGIIKWGILKIKDDLNKSLK